MFNVHIYAGRQVEWMLSISIFPVSKVRHGLPRWCQCEEWRRCKRCRFDPWVRNIPWWRKWQPAPVFLPGKFHGQMSPVGYSPWGCKGSDTTEHACKVRPTKVWWLFQNSTVTNKQSRETCWPLEPHSSTFHESLVLPSVRENSGQSYL